MCLANRPALPSVGRAVRPSSVPIPVLIAHHSPTQPGVCATEAKDASHARSTLTCVLHSGGRHRRGTLSCKAGPSLLAIEDGKKLRCQVLAALRRSAILFDWSAHKRLCEQREGCVGIFGSMQRPKPQHLIASASGRRDSRLPVARPQLQSRRLMRRGRRRLPLVSLARRLSWGRPMEPRDEKAEKARPRPLPSAG